jgi:hypothetical protein
MTRDRGQFIKTHAGLHFHPFDPRPEDICIEDIAHALAHQCRFSGHVSRHYSVASHSLYVAEMVAGWGCKTKIVLSGLMHDASEAYLVDVPKPLKPRLIGYQKIEDAVSAVICKKFGVLYPWPKEVMEADLRAMYVEGNDLLGGTEDWPKDDELNPLWVNDPGVSPVPSSIAKQMFLSCFRVISGWREG